MTKFAIFFLPPVCCVTLAALLLRKWVRNSRGKPTLVGDWYINYVTPNSYSY